MSMSETKMPSSFTSHVSYLNGMTLSDELCGRARFAGDDWSEDMAAWAASSCCRGVCKMGWGSWSELGSVEGRVLGCVGLVGNAVCGEVRGLGSGGSVTVVVVAEVSPRATGTFEGGCLDVSEVAGG